MLKDDYFLPDNLCLVLVSTALPVLISLGSLPMEVQILLDLLELLSGGSRMASPRLRLDAIWIILVLPTVLLLPEKQHLQWFKGYELCRIQRTPFGISSRDN